MVMAELPIIGVGHYDIIRTIGKGNFASVKLARHQITKTEVAIKIIEKYRLDASDLGKVYREIQILKLLKHPHIMKLYEVIQTKTKIFLVCEYASNGEVFDYITQEERIPEDKARKMFYQVLTAIEYCHKNFVVHRDLKAENLLLDGNDNIKLADFGFGNFFQSGQNLNTWCGSPPYAAPEVFEGKLYEGPQLDIWSLGIVLYVLVCGTFPFDGSNLASLKERVLAGRFRIPYWMSQDCENLIRRILVVNPKKRLTIAQIKKHKWLEPVVTKPEANFRNCDSPSRRSGSNQLPEFNEHILKQMQDHRMDRLKTLESLRKSSYDSLYATYHLLLDKSKHHRTSVPIESKIVNDWGRRRPSNIAEQSLAKQVQPGSPTAKPVDSYRQRYKNHYLNSKHRSHVAHNDNFHADEYPSSDVRMQRHDVQFVEESGNDMSPVHRPLHFPVLSLPQHSQVPMSPPGGNKPKFITQPCRGPLPHQPWSFNAGVGVRTVHYQSPYSLATESHRDVIPSVTSIDEGVELRSTSPSEQEMIKLAASQQRRHTLGIPESFAPLTHIGPNNTDIAFHPSRTRGESQADSLFGSSVVSTLESETLCDSLEMAHDSTPKVVLSPCLDEASQSAAVQDSHVSYVEKQRQLLDVSPTGFREGRRASDGLLLLADGKLGEHLKKLSKANQFPPINQEENDDSCFETIQKERETSRPAQLQVTTEVKTNELGAMMSHSSHQVMQAPRVEAINFQPYTSSNRRRSFQVAQYLADERCNSYSKGFETPLVRQQALTMQPAHVQFHSGQSCEQPDDDHLYQWSSWKTVTENELPNSDTLQHRRETLPLLNRGEMGACPVWSDESMGRISTAEKPLRHPSLTTANHMGPQSLVQVLQKRRFNRRRNIAQNIKQTGSNYQLPEFELLQIADNFNANHFNKPESLEELSGRMQNQNVIRAGLGAAAFNPYARHSPELQQNLVLVENQESGFAVYNNSSAIGSLPQASIANWVPSHRTDSPPSFQSPTAMEYTS